MSTDERVGKPVDQQRRAYWLKTLHQWHWISSAVCLVGMLLFAVTGITLNHAAQIDAEPRGDHARRAPAGGRCSRSLAAPADAKAPLPPALRRLAGDDAVGVALAARRPNGRTTRSTCRCRARAATPG